MDAEPVDFADTAALEQMFGATGQAVAQSAEAVMQARALGADDPMIWAIIAGSFTVMFMGAGRQVLNKAADIWKSRSDMALREREVALDEQHELFLKRHRLKHYAMVPPDAEIVD